MAEIVLACLLLFAGFALGLLALIVLFGSAFGAATNANAARNWPILVLVIASIAAFAGGVLLLVF